MLQSYQHRRQYHTSQFHIQVINLLLSSGSVNLCGRLIKRIGSNEPILHESHTSAQWQYRTPADQTLCGCPNPYLALFQSWIFVWTRFYTYWSVTLNIRFWFIDVGQWGRGGGRDSSAFTLPQNTPGTITARKIQRKTTDSNSFPKTSDVCMRDVILMWRWTIVWSVWTFKRVYYARGTFYTWVLQQDASILRWQLPYFRNGLWCVCDFDYLRILLQWDAAVAHR